MGSFYYGRERVVYARVSLVLLKTNNDNRRFYYFWRKDVDRGTRRDVRVVIIIIIITITTITIIVIIIIIIIMTITVIVTGEEKLRKFAKSYFLTHPLHSHSWTISILWRYREV
jgi:hypothetical protein